MSRLRPLALAAAVLATTILPSEAAAQLLSNVEAVSINATKAASLTVTVTSGASQTTNALADNSIVTFAAPVIIQTSWDLNPGQTGTVTLLGSFSNPAQALANGGDYITSTRMEGRVATGTPTAFTAFTQNGVGAVGTTGGSLTLFSESITGVNKQKTRNDNLDLRINLTGQTVTAGTYAGTLNIQAIAQ